MGPGLMEKMVDGLLDSSTVKTEPVEPEMIQLTPREQDVLNLIGVGSTNREIARQLYITEGTVKSHLTHIFNRLNLRNRSQLAIYAISAKQNC
jgi:DNA-binding NarL/FixJ family response regulator